MSSTLIGLRHSQCGTDHTFLKPTSYVACRKDTNNWPPSVVFTYHIWISICTIVVIRDIYLKTNTQPSTIKGIGNNTFQYTLMWCTLQRQTVNCKVRKRIVVLPHTMTSKLIGRWHSQCIPETYYFSSLSKRYAVWSLCYIYAGVGYNNKKPPYLSNVHGRSTVCQWRCHSEHSLPWCQGTRSVRDVSVDLHW